MISFAQYCNYFLSKCIVIIKIRGIASMKEEGREVRTHG
jgi:hypothetical protein